jgi:hypothetical protein
MPNGTLIEFWDEVDAEGNEQQRRYRVNGERFANVTTILNVLAKDALLEWAARLAKEGKDWKAVRAQAGERGKVSHHLLLQILTGQGGTLADLSPEHRSYGQAGFKSIRDLRPKVLECERMVASVTHKYAGRLDLFAEIDGIKTLVDFKTLTRWAYERDRDTKELTDTLLPPYAENLLQLDLYQGARIECGLEPAERGLVLRLGPDAEYDPTFAELDPERGIAILGAYRTKQDAEKVLRKASKAGQTERKLDKQIEQMVEAVA